IKLLSILAKRDVSVLVLARNEPQLTAEFHRHKKPGWELIEAPTQPHYFRCLQWLTESRCPVLVSKPGPNTVLAAAYFGIPTVLLESGLPMEDWVAGLVEDEGFGCVLSTVEKLIAMIDRLTRSPELIAQYQARARAFST